MVFHFITCSIDCVDRYYTADISRLYHPNRARNEGGKSNLDFEDFSRKTSHGQVTGECGDVWSTVFMLNVIPGWEAILNATRQKMTFYSSSHFSMSPPCRCDESLLIVVCEL